MCAAKLSFEELDSVTGGKLDSEARNWFDANEDKINARMELMSDEVVAKWSKMRSRNSGTFSKQDVMKFFEEIGLDYSDFQ